MPNKKTITIIGMSSLLLSTMTLAAVQSLPKDEWLAAFKKLAPAAICQHLVDDPDANKLLAKASVSYDKCVTLMPTSIDKCQTKLYSDVPENITKKNEPEWAKKLGSCIGVDFFSNNIVMTSDNSSSTPAN